MSLDEGEREQVTGVNVGTCVVRFLLKKLAKGRRLEVSKACARITLPLTRALVFDTHQNVTLYHGHQRSRPITSRPSLRPPLPSPLPSPPPHRRPPSRPPPIQMPKPSPPGPAPSSPLRYILYHSCIIHTQTQLSFHGIPPCVEMCRPP